MRQRKFSISRKKHSRRVRSEIRPSEAEMTSGSSRCQKAQDIADNTLSAITLNILIHTNHVAPGDA